MVGVQYVEVARATSPRGEVLLRRRRPDADDPPGSGAALELRVGGVFVMDTVEVGTEQRLASAALDLTDRPADVLVGGLGLGFTLERVLVDPRVRRCTVVELEPALVGWLRDGTVPHGPALLADPRTRVVVADVAEHLRAAADASYDLVLIDVDNGPGQLVHPANAALYEATLLRRVADVLRPGGAVVVWSAAEAPELERALADVFDRVEVVGLPVDLQGRAERYWLYLGRRGEDG